MSPAHIEPEGQETLVWARQTDGPGERIVRSRVDVQFLADEVYAETSIS